MPRKVDSSSHASAETPAPAPEPKAPASEPAPGTGSKRKSLAQPESSASTPAKRAVVGPIGLAAQAKAFATGFTTAVQKEITTVLGAQLNLFAFHFDDRPTGPAAADASPHDTPDAAALKQVREP